MNYPAEYPRVDTNDEIGTEHDNDETISAPLQRETDVTYEPDVLFKN